MKKLLLFLFLFTSVTMIADDIIVTKDSQRINAKIEEIGLEVVKYRRSDNLNGPLYTLAKTDIVTILYENGMVETFQQTQQAVGQQSYHLLREGNIIYQNGRALLNREYVNLLRNTCPQAFNEYKKGTQLANAGWGIFAGGALFAAVGVPICFVDDILGIGVGLVATGCALFITSTPLLTLGYRKQYRSVDIYNSTCTPAITYNLTASQNGIGLAINF